MSKTYKLNESDLETFKKMYFDEIKMDKIAKYFDVGVNTIYRYKERYNVPTRKCDLPLPINHDFFETIDTERKAYWVGFLLADGNVFGNYISLRLATIDLNHIELFKTHIESGHKVTTSHCTTSKGPGLFSGIKACSNKMAKDLAKVGVVPCKSLIARPPKIRKNLERHFWRGVIDGDGCICINIETDRASVSLAGTKAICSGFMDWVFDSLGKKRVKIHQHDGKRCYYITYSGKQVAAKIASLLYVDSTVYLERKHKKFKDLEKMASISYKEKRFAKAKKNNQPFKCNETGKIYYSFTSAAKDTGCSYQQVKDRLNNVPRNVKRQYGAKAKYSFSYI